MRENKIAALRGYKSQRFHYHKPAKAAPNPLSQQFAMQMPDEAWVTDITYIRTFQGWLYLAVVLDLFSRKVIGWSMKSTLAKEIVLDAILMAVWRRKLSTPVLVHSDLGSHYSSHDWQDFLKTQGLESAGVKGDRTRHRTGPRMAKPATGSTLFQRPSGPSCAEDP